MSFINIECYNSTSSNYHLSKKLIEKLELSSKPQQKEREILFIEQVCKNVRKSKSVLYVLSLDNQYLGLVATSVTAIADFPSVQIDFIFTDNRFRGQELEVIDNMRVSEFLIDLVINEAKEIQQKVGLKYIVLLPDNDKLIARYKELGFNTLNHKVNEEGWMFLPI